MSEELICMRCRKHIKAFTIVSDIRELQIKEAYKFTPSEFTGLKRVLRGRLIDIVQFVDSIKGYKTYGHIYAVVNDRHVSDSTIEYIKDTADHFNALKFNEIDCCEHEEVRPMSKEDYEQITLMEGELDYREHVR